jgi:hypothetical protein
MTEIMKALKDQLRVKLYKYQMTLDSSQYCWLWGTRQSGFGIYAEKDKWSCNIVHSNKVLFYEDISSFVEAWLCAIFTYEKMVEDENV